MTPVVEPIRWVFFIAMIEDYFYYLELWELIFDIEKLDFKDMEAFDFWWENYYLNGWTEE